MLVPTAHNLILCKIVLFPLLLYRMSLEKGIDKELLIGPAHGFSSQFLNLFGFSISVSFVRCII